MSSSNVLTLHPDDLEIAQILDDICSRVSSDLQRETAIQINEEAMDITTDHSIFNSEIIQVATIDSSAIEPIFPVAKMGLKMFQGQKLDLDEIRKHKKMCIIIPLDSAPEVDTIKIRPTSVSLSEDSKSIRVMCELSEVEVEVEMDPTSSESLPLIKEENKQENQAKTVSPALNPVSCTLYIRKLARPFTINELKELLGQTGTLLNDAVWTDKMRSMCFATYKLQEDAVKTRNELHGFKWPRGNHNGLIVDYANDNVLLSHMGPAEATIFKDKTENKLAISKKHSLIQEKTNPEKKQKVEEKETRKPEKKEERKPERREERKPERREERKPEKKEERKPERREERKPETKEENEEKICKQTLSKYFRKTKCKPHIYWMPKSEDEIKMQYNNKKERYYSSDKSRSRKR